MQTNTCPNCRHQRRDGTEFCHTCGTAVATARGASATHPSSSAVSSKSAEHRSSCPNWGRPLRRGARFCSGCGSAGLIAEAPAVTAEALTETRRLAAGASVTRVLTRVLAKVSARPEVRTTPTPPRLQTPQRPPSEPANAALAPGNPPPRRSASPLALVVLGAVALAGIAFGGLEDARVFSHAGSTQTITAAIAVRPPAGHATPAAQRNTTSPVPAAPAGTTSCGAGINVGPNTSCSFAQNVEQAYFHGGGGNSLVTAYSPATGLTYTIDCTGGVPHVCTGGTTRNASIYFTNGTAPNSAPSAAAGPAPSSSAAQAAGSQPIYFWSSIAATISAPSQRSDDREVVRPSTIYLLADGSWDVDHLQWTGWGSSVAHAQGISSASNGIPNMAQGKRITNPGQISLSHPGRFQGREVYRCYALTVPPPASSLHGCLADHGGYWSFEQS